MLLLQKVRKGSGKELISERLKKKKRNNKILITVTVLRSAGPIRLMVNEDDPVSRVISAILKSYAGEGRLPVLGFNSAHFFLCCRGDFQEAIGSRGGRNFVLCKKEIHQPWVIKEDRVEMMADKVAGWKAWLRKSFSFKVVSH
ncbi:hypothetical protein SAY87_011462 [Trapa incisa]|uniref:DUF7054 domain-containing protein n=1 Tax=Trapa incisa TaxID=236973 RepID=A0AAN7JJ43_9MYRT|nr:hypothetical protein SAY87_011462 [Trapa incisa]